MEAKEMISMYDKLSIIKMIVEDGYSIRKVSRITGRDRKTISKYYKEHKELEKQLEEALNDQEVRAIQNKIVQVPHYPKRKSTYRKWTKAMDDFMEYHLEAEKDRNLKLGVNHKQKLTITMMHELMLEADFEIGMTTVRNNMNRKREKLQAVFIRQIYQPAQRLEFDYGEVLLMIGGVKTKVYMAVISSPYSNFRTAYLYHNQGQKTFLDAHNRVFSELGGVPREMVYDNMRNVVTKFIGHNEKELNEKLLQMALYYGFEVNVTNVFSGHEKGHVENSVGYIRKKAFTTHYEFDTIKAAEDRLNETLNKINKDSKIEDEKVFYQPLKKLLDLSEIKKAKVNKYSLIQIESDFYSVPEQLVNQEVIVKNYLNDIEVYYNHKLVCKHHKKDGALEYVIDINHFLRTFKQKPGALKNSQALLNNPELKTIFETYYSTQVQRFIELLTDHKHKSKCELNEILLNNHSPLAQSKVIETNIQKAASQQINQYMQMMKRNKH